MCAWAWARAWAWEGGRLDRREREKGNILMSSWVAPYFSLGSTGYIKDEVSSQNRSASPQGYVGALELKSNP